MSGFSHSILPPSHLNSSSVEFDCRISAIVVVVSFLQPINHLPVERLLDGDVRHRGSRGSAVPVFDTRREPDHVTRTNLLNRAVLLLHPAATKRNDERLSEWVRMPDSAGSGFKGDAGSCGASRGFH